MPFHSSCPGVLQELRSRGEICLFSDMSFRPSTPVQLQEFGIRVVKSVPIRPQRLVTDEILFLFSLGRFSISSVVCGVAWNGYNQVSENGPAIELCFLQNFSKRHTSS